MATQQYLSRTLAYEVGVARVLRPSWYNLYKLVYGTADHRFECYSKLIKFADVADAIEMAVGQSSKNASSLRPPRRRRRRSIQGQYLDCLSLTIML